MLAKEISDNFNEGQALSILGLISLHQGNTTRARSLFEENLALWKEEGDKRDLSRVIAFLARVEAREGHYAAARAYYEESLAILKEAYYKWYEFDLSAFLEGLASVLAAQGVYVGAARALGAAEALREIVGIPIPPVERDDYEQTVAAVRTHVGEQAFATAWTQGRDMTLEQVFNEALKMNGKARK
jgi:tetratricopeptide (TPR) repeat protein